MRKYFKYKIIGFVLILAGVVSCDTATQDVEPVISPANYPVASFATSSSSASLTEGDTLTYTITMDKMLDRAITFTAVITGGTADEDDLLAEPVVMNPYNNEVKLYIIANDDGFPEIDETLEFEIRVLSIAERYLLNQNTVFPSASLTLVNVNDPTLLTIAFSWPTDDDMDIVTWSDTPDYPHTEWGDGGATGSNPEVDKSIWLSDPVGTYYVNIMDWDAGIEFDYTFTLGHPDGTLQIINGTFDGTDKSIYTNDQWTAWGGSYDSYRILKVVNDGTKFTVTSLQE
jgi:hypothetical protein